MGSEMFRYVVRAEIDDSGAAAEYLAWLSDGHVEQVCECSGAEAEIVRLDAEHAIFEVHYAFPTRAAFDTYEREHAPRLRAEGMDRFAGRVRFSRSTGEVVFQNSGARNSVRRMT
jgi:hypothetical protein